MSIQADPRLTVLTSLVEMFGPLQARLPPPVVARARVLARGLPMPELLAPYTPVSCYCPDFLSRSTAPSRSFDEQLEELRETSDHVVLRDLGRDEDYLSSASELVAADAAAAVSVAAIGRRHWNTWRENPRRSLGRYCSLLRQYRRTVVDGVYPGFESVLRREVHRLEAATAEWGPEISLGQVHPNIRFADGRMTYDQTKVGVQRGWSPDALVLKPMVCSPRTRLSDMGYSSFTGEAQAVIGVATGSLKVTGRRSNRRTDHLEILLGHPRARILRALKLLPGTTTDLAGELGYAPSTISGSSYLRWVMG